jgi:protein-disulfide isomerase
MQNAELSRKAKLKSVPSAVEHEWLVRFLRARRRQEETLKTIIRVFCFAVFFASIVSAQSRKSAHAQKAAPSANGSTATTISVKHPSMEMLNSFMHHMFGYDPMIKWKVESVRPSDIPGVTEVVATFGEPPQQRTVFYVAGDLEHAFIGQIIPFGADPFAPVRKKLAADAKGPVQGSASAPVEIVEFSDFECPHCKKAQPKLEQLMNESPNARLVFENFPLSNIHKWADLAAGYADCIGRSNPDKFWKFFHSVFDQQEQITDQTAATKLSSLATDAGVDAGATATCANSPETKARVNQQYELGVSVGVNATPTLFLNGRKIENVNDTPVEVLKQMIDFEAGESQKK